MFKYHLIFKVCKIFPKCFDVPKKEWWKVLLGICIFINEWPQPFWSIWMYICALHMLLFNYSCFWMSPPTQHNQRWKSYFTFLGINEVIMMWELVMFPYVLDSRWDSLKRIETGKWIWISTSVLLYTTTYLCHTYISKTSSPKQPPPSNELSAHHIQYQTSINYKINMS